MSGDPSAVANGPRPGPPPGASAAAAGPEAAGDLWTRAEHRRRRRLQIRSVRRIVRRVELWSVLKLSMILYLCLWAVLLLAALILWNAVDSTGLIDRIEAFVTQIFGLDSFAFDPGQIFRVYAVASLVMAFLATVFNVMAAILFNLISEFVGGLRIMLVEEESARYRPARPRPRRRAARGDGAPEAVGAARRAASVDGPGL
ncbi:MAG: DUF3566 domain-containing protein [bacterium]|nr:DUF3566 domain-containing protein [bacterium]